MLCGIHHLHHKVSPFAPATTGFPFGGTRSSGFVERQWKCRVSFCGRLSTLCFFAVFVVMYKRVKERVGGSDISSFFLSLFCWLYVMNVAMCLCLSNPHLQCTGHTDLPRCFPVPSNPPPPNCTPSPSRETALDRCLCRCRPMACRCGPSSPSPSLASSGEIPNR